MKWMKNSKGKEDFSLTMAFASFVVVSVAIFLSMFKSLTLKAFSFELVQPDTALLSMYLATCFGAYVGRKHSDRLKEEDKEQK